MVRLIIRYALIGGVAVLVGVIGVMLMMPSRYRLEGTALGSSYHIWLSVPRYKGFPYQIQENAEAIFHRVDALMSVSREDSQVSSFNLMQTTLPMAVDPWLYQVLEAAQRVSDLTQGALDVTAGPLTNLWRHKGEGGPLPYEIEFDRRRVGYRYLELLTDNRIRKTVPDLEINVSALATGFAMDQITYMLIDAGISNFVVELGTDVRVQGRPAHDRKWRIGIRGPNPLVVALENRSVATRGGRLVVDPRTGHPASGPINSVTVISNSCMWADALGMALRVLPVEEALRIATQFPDTEALFILGGTEVEAATTMATPGFASFVVR